MLGFQLFTNALQSSSNVRVIYMHGVPESALINFTNIVAYLTTIRTALSPDNYFSFLLKDYDLNSRCFMITFDDGLLSSYKAAKKVLEPLGIKAIFFIPTAVLDIKTDEEMRHFAAEKLFYGTKHEGVLSLDKYIFMNKDQIKELASEGHMICPHTHSHAIISDINDEVSACTELIQPKEILEDILQTKIEAFAFPVGTEKQAGPFAYNVIRKYYQFCFTALNGINKQNSNRYYLCRNNIPANAPLSYVKLVMNGAYDLYYIRKTHLLKKKTQIEI